MDKVKVVLHNGQVVNSTSNENVGYVRVEQVSSGIVNGWHQVSKRGALIMGSPDVLRENYFEGKTLPGKIVVKETLEPRYDGQSPKINPSTGEVLTKNGMPIYRNTEYTGNPEEFDVLIAHDRVMQTVEDSQVAHDTMSIV